MINHQLKLTSKKLKLPKGDYVTISKTDKFIYFQNGNEINKYNVSRCDYIAFAPNQDGTLSAWKGEKMILLQPLLLVSL